MEGLNTGKWDCHVGFTPLQGPAASGQKLKFDIEVVLI
jgi:hypothetical protein